MQCMLVNDNFLSLSAEIKKIQASVKQSRRDTGQYFPGPPDSGGSGYLGGLPGSPERGAGLPQEILKLLHEPQRQVLTQITRQSCDILF